jgi:hypothetical protein
MAQKEPSASQFLNGHPPLEILSCTEWLTQFVSTPVHPRFLSVLLSSLAHCHVSNALSPPLIGIRAGNCTFQLTARRTGFPIPEFPRITLGDLALSS